MKPALILAAALLYWWAVGRALEAAGRRVVGA